MEELSEGGSRRLSRGVDERKEKGVAEGVWQKKVAATKIVGRTKKRENRYEKEEDICFSEEDIFLRRKRYFSEGERKREVGGTVEGEEPFRGREKEKN